MNIPHFSDDWIKEWCDDNGWTDLFRERCDHYWAFPPGAVMPEPIPTGILRSIKSAKGLCVAEKRLIAVAMGLSGLAIALSYFTKSPMPIVFAFAFDAMVAALLEVEEV
jgi:hypothetical protein